MASNADIKFLGASHSRKSEDGWSKKRPSEKKVKFANALKG